MPRYAILQHDSRRAQHWDLLLETGETLKTWALAQAPAAGVEIPCDALPDHRLAYLDYEGPVSGGRGSVVRWDWGTYRIEHQDDVRLVVALAGERLVGRVALTAIPNEPGKWRFLLT